MSRFDETPEGEWDEYDDDGRPQDLTHKFTKIVALDQFEREVTKDNLKFSRLPYWEQARLEGDYLPEDSGMNNGDRE